jgi:serine protease Do
MQNKLSGYGPSLIVLATAMLVLFAGPSAVRKLTFERTRAQIYQASLRLSADDNILEQINQAYRDIADRVEPSVVHVSVRQLIETPRGPTQAISSGSGWVYDDQGHIVTNYHVVRDADRIEVQLDNGELRDAMFIGADETTDIALLKVPAGRLHAATLADPDEAVRQGDMVFAFGSPFDFRFSMSSGVVSGKGRSVGVIRDRRGRRVGYENFIQVDAAINPGNSGGPLTNFRGQVIGMNTAIATGRQASPMEEGQFAGIGLAIPLEMILPVVDQIIENGFVAKGFLGVNNIIDFDLDPQLAQRYRGWGFIGQGVVLTTVLESGPAARAGLKDFDIVVRVNDRPTQTVSQLQSIISSVRPGELVKVEVWRYDPQRKTGEEIAYSVRLDRLNSIIATGVIPPDQPRDQLPELGIASMSDSSQQLADRFDAVFRPGVIITEVVADSMLGRTAEAGWTIVGVMDKQVTNVDEFIEALRAQFDLRRGVNLDLIDTNGEYHRAAVRPERY